VSGKLTKGGFVSTEMQLSVSERALQEAKSAIEQLAEGAGCKVKAELAEALANLMLGARTQSTINRGLPPDEQLEQDEPYDDVQFGRLITEQGALADTCVCGHKVWAHLSVNEQLRRSGLTASCREPGCNCEDYFERRIKV